MNDSNFHTEKHGEGTAVTLALFGNLNSASAPDFEADLKKALATADSLTLDCTGLVYTSSAGLRLFLLADQALENKGGLRLIHVSSEVKEVLDMTGLGTIIRVE
jgi:anti-sigma B factor antagonist